MRTQDEDQVREALHAVLAKAATLTNAAPLVGFDSRLDVDYGGSDAVYVTAVVADRSNLGEPYEWAELAPIYDLIWDEFVSRGIERIPHTTFRQEHEPHDEPDLLAGSEP